MAVLEAAMVITATTPGARLKQIQLHMNCVVKSTFSIDTGRPMPHRKGNAAAFGMCAGLAFPTAAHTKGGN